MRDVNEIKKETLGLLVDINKEDISAEQLDIKFREVCALIWVLHDDMREIIDRIEDHSSYYVITFSNKCRMNVGKCLIGEHLLREFK